MFFVGVCLIHCGFHNGCKVIKSRKFSVKFCSFQIFYSFFAHVVKVNVVVLKFASDLLNKVNSTSYW